MDMNWTISIGTQPKYNTSRMLSGCFDSLAADARLNFRVDKYFFQEKFIGIPRNCECIQCNIINCTECSQEIQKGKENIIYWSDENSYPFCNTCVMGQLERIQEIVNSEGSEYGNF